MLWGKFNLWTVILRERFPLIKFMRLITCLISLWPFKNLYKPLHCMGSNFFEQWVKVSNETVDFTLKFSFLSADAHLKAQDSPFAEVNLWAFVGHTERKIEEKHWLLALFFKLLTVFFFLWEAENEDVLWSYFSCSERQRDKTGALREFIRGLTQSAKGTTAFLITS
jgi:hypothetical protein